MICPSSSDGGAQAISFRVHSTIKSIREVVGNHSDAYIYSVLRETNMDPNETAQRLLHRDPFHEVRRRDKGKDVYLSQNTGYGKFIGTRMQRENKVQWAKSERLPDRIAKQGGYPRNPVAGIIQEFRIVKDNRFKQEAHKEVGPESFQDPDSSKEQVVADILDKSSTGTLTDLKHSAARNSEGQKTAAGNAKEIKPHSHHQLALPKDAQWTVSSPPVAQRGTQRNSVGPPVASVPSKPSVEICCSSSDPIHVPSPDSRSAGSAGAIQREVGVVGVRKQASDHPGASTSISNSLFSISLAAKDSFSLAEQTGHSGATLKNSRFSQPRALDTRMLASSQYNAKLYLQSVGHQKATQPNMEWKPKSGQKASTISHVDVIQTTADASDDQNQMAVVKLTKKLSVANSDDEHVIIPDRLRVPESETIELIFGSFESGFDSAKGVPSVSEAVGNSTEPENQSSVSMSASIAVISSEKVSAVDQAAVLEAQARIQSDSSLSTAECDRALPGNMGSPSPQNISNYGKSGLVTNHASQYSSPNPLHLQVNANPPAFKAYEDHSHYEMPFLNSSVEVNGTAQDMAFTNEEMSSHPTIIGQMSMQQQQSMAQIYPQAHAPHFSNILPYRHIYSPVYAPPMAVPNYSNNPAYSHPSHGNSYLLVPNGNSHLTASGMKYASQYKPIFPSNPNGYGNYSNPIGYSAGPGTIGSSPILDDVNTIKYKDGSLYVPNPQDETSDIWIQTPRELPNMQPSPYFNLPGQAAAAHAAYLPIHNGYASYNAAAQATHVPYPGLHPSAQTASMALFPSPHNLVPQQVPLAPLGGNVGVAVAAGAQAGGAFQQNQLGHSGWAGASF